MVQIPTSICCSTMRPVTATWMIAYTLIPCPWDVFQNTQLCSTQSNVLSLLGKQNLKTFYLPTKISSSIQMAMEEGKLLYLHFDLTSWRPLLMKAAERLKLTSVLRGKTTALPIMLGVSRWRTSCKLVNSVDVMDLYQVFIPVVYINFICSIGSSAVLFELPLGMDFLCVQFESPIVLFERSQCSIRITKGVISLDRLTGGGNWISGGVINRQNPTQSRLGVFSVSFCVCCVERVVLTGELCWGTWWVLRLLL